MTSQAEPVPNSFLRRAWYLSITVLYLATLAGGLAVLDTKLEDISALEFLVPYQQYLALLHVGAFGWLAISSGRQWVFLTALRYASRSTAGAFRIIFQIVALGIFLSILVGLLTENWAAALTLGSFGGLVAGFATQTVLGNAVAGLFLAVGRPFDVGDEVTVGGNSGTVADITLMHTVLVADGQEIMIPSRNVSSSVIVRRKRALDAAGDA